MDDPRRFGRKELHVFVLLILISSYSTLSVKDDDVCQGKPADVIFILDSSSSIGHLDFDRQLEFVINIIDIFDVSPNMTQIGVISFSNWAFLDFHLNTYSSSSDIKSAVARIRQIRGDTNTAAALQYMQDISFSKEHGARKGNPHIAIILTDGKSNKPMQTMKEAVRARLASRIHIFAIGVGDEVERKELRAIASDPKKNYIFQVGNYESLDSIKDLLAIKTCRVTDAPTTLPPPTAANLEMVVDQACGDASIADIMLAVSPSASSDNTNKALDFYKEVVGGFDLGSDNIRIGMVPKDCAAMPEVDAQSYDEQDMVMKQLEMLIESQPSTSSVLRYMRRTAFHKDNGGRRKAKRIGVVIVDSADQRDINRVLREAGKAKIMKQIELFVIGIGKELNPFDLKLMASKPPEQHVFHVSDYDELESISALVRQAICPVQTL